MPLTLPSPRAKDDHDDGDDDDDDDGDDDDDDDDDDICVSGTAPGSLSGYSAADILSWARCVKLPPQSERKTHNSLALHIWFG
jgi:hypothetical protein